MRVRLKYDQRCKVYKKRPDFLLQFGFCRSHILRAFALVLRRSDATLLQKRRAVVDCSR